MSNAAAVFRPRTTAEVEAIFDSARRAKKVTVKQFKDAVVASDRFDELGKAAVLRWFRGRITG